MFQNLKQKLSQQQKKSINYNVNERINMSSDILEAINQAVLDFGKSAQKVESLMIAFLESQKKISTACDRIKEVDKK